MSVSNLLKVAGATLDQRHYVQCMTSQTAPGQLAYEILRSNVRGQDGQNVFKGVFAPPAKSMQ